MARRSVDLVNQKPPAAEDVLEAVHALMHQVRAQQHRALKDAEHGLTPMDARVLGFFARRPGATLSDLVAHALRDKGQLARLVGGLRERGLLEARVDEADRRNQRIHLTPAGEALYQDVRRHARRLSAAAVRGFSEEEKRALLALLARMGANLDAARAGE